ncbi:hypothetical protein MPTK1_4g23950 [Marchantia polymorpha subsp. ruderalis]|uniref:Uncharacterized protein n=2 Tax=Marchantia polymorpha TaxID=3197 RepID=A0A176WFL3_MARPO|nr:hypothetical protein AXG93_2278s1060 [Marchantia polymorpha subsp. ruderalis]PTQ44521.1 hypothetical protein MARPO_0020s0154 [Marchantia polymorpha]PTQ44522.1 hypothetical protein MARPO_0020s0154 [Marchantia polymorpha]BBN09947.1 hypothetical protein Mp_4g23950 [Marchantia polymorpha subsp. ruderalis]BBN09948.1 hypothetical protein Mp_4g23950 [Marchantia polymorpha subsp. ruderalis]|eukprot:PTQ44521.1 hypothetical protein MARPO_0020s0154 [Marchantia polymorpha]
MGPYRWKQDKSIQLLDAVKSWENDIKGTHPKGGKWQWVAKQLFVPDEQWDLLALSRRCERRAGLLRTKYEVYCLQLTLFRSKSSPKPPSVKIDAELLKKMRSTFGELKLSSTPSTLTVARALAMRSRDDVKVPEEEVEESEDEDFDHQSWQEDTSSSVGSTHSYHDSAAEFSSKDIFSPSDGHSKNLVALPGSFSMCEGIANSQSQLSSSEEFSNSQGTSFFESSTDGASMSTESYLYRADTLKSPAESRSRSSNTSFRSGHETTASPVNVRSLLEDLESFSPFAIPSPGADQELVNAGETRRRGAADPEGGESRNKSPLSSKSQSCRNCCTSLNPCYMCATGSWSSSVRKGSGSTSSSSDSCPSSAYDLSTTSSSSEPRGSAAGGSIQSNSQRTRSSDQSSSNSTHYGDEHSQRSSQQLPVDFENLTLNSQWTADESTDSNQSTSKKDERSTGRTGSQSGARGGRGFNTSRSHNGDHSASIRGIRKEPSRSSHSSGDGSASSEQAGLDDNLNLTVYIKLDNIRTNREAG